MACNTSTEDNTLSDDENDHELDKNKSPSEKKTKCDYRKGKKQAKYSLQDKAKVIKMITRYFQQRKQVSDAMACDGDVKDGESDGDIQTVNTEGDITVI